MKQENVILDKSFSFSVRVVKLLTSIVKIGQSNNSKLSIHNSTLLTGKFVKWYREFYGEMKWTY